MITQQQALEALDELEGSARGDEPFNHFAAPLLRQYLEQSAPGDGVRFQWCCANGCGACEVKRIEFEYERTETLDGDLVSSKTQPRLVSKCCGADLIMWDADSNEELLVVTVEPISGAQHPQQEQSK